MDRYREHLRKQGFNLQDEIGRGLSGTTRSALQPSLSRKVAVKFFDTRLNRDNEELKKRFKREAFILAEVQHPSIPYVITHGSISVENGSIPYIVMQYIEGDTLDKYFDSHRPLSYQYAISVVTQLLEALVFIHSKGVIHRDIKPANIMVSELGHCYLIDFSIGFCDSDMKNFTRATSTGDHLGSIDYMSPEQKLDMKSVDARGDIYSLGLVLCYMLSGHPTPSVLDKLSGGTPVKLKQIIKKACSLEIKDRFQSADEFLRELKNISNLSVSQMRSPKKALCNNQKCPGAVWSPNGYYKGANYIDHSSNIHCTDCGNKLIYECECGYPIADTPFCGGCGVQLATVPECEKCGSHLQREDIGSDTAKDGCSKCRSRESTSNPAIPIYQPPQAFRSTVPSEFDDDIPF
ncbi:protein kinase domain-containing protein [Microbulbifer sp. ANSA005]|uniref:protein kinase domain-containing protein n=1 Tax=Microbulbifer sp. ANSA005 TaxID=3243362 RepID=UPI004043746C